MQVECMGAQLEHLHDAQPQHTPQHQQSTARALKGMVAVSMLAICPMHPASFFQDRLQCSALTQPVLLLPPTQSCTL